MFYCLYDGFTNRLARYTGPADQKLITCPVHDGHRRMGLRRSPLDVVWRSKTVPAFLWTWLSECLLTDRTVELLKSEGLTGFELQPVKAVFPRAADPPESVWELKVTGWGGMAGLESGIELVECCDACGHLHYSGCDCPEKLIDPSQWDGSDFFMVWPLPRFIFVTERAAKTIRVNKLKGAKLKRPEELDLSGGFTPGRLSDWMPEQRARQLGEPLGIY